MSTPSGGNPNPNPPSGGVGVPPMVLSKTAEEMSRRREELIRLRKEKLAARNVVVPTDDTQVRRELRSFGEPITLFGEDNHARRERLRAIKHARMEAGTGSTSPPPGGQIAAEDEKEEEFFSKGSEGLVEWRKKLVKDTFGRAGARMDRLKKEFLAWKEATKSHNSPELLHSAVRQRTVEAKRNASEYRCSLSVLGIGRPTGFGPAHVRPFTALASVPPSTNTSSSGTKTLIATGCEDGSMTVWDAREGSPLLTFVQPTLMRVNDVACALTNDKQKLLFASASRDHAVYLWSTTAGLSEDERKDLVIGQLAPAAVFAGHLGPVSRLAFHPLASMGSLASTSEDMTWRLWDVERALPTAGSGSSSVEPLLVQEGHNVRHGRCVHGLSFHPDGSLLTTTDFSGQALTWDLRSGKMIFKLPVPHKGKATAVLWQRGGVFLATGGEDQEIALWDLRGQKDVLRIAAHDDLITSIDFVATPSLPSPSTTLPPAHMIVSGSVDRTVRFWDFTNGAPLQTLFGHQGAVRKLLVLPTEPMGRPVSGGGVTLPPVVTVAKDRYWRLWAGEIGQQEGVKKEAPKMRVVDTGAGKAIVASKPVASKAASNQPQDTAEDEGSSDDELSALRVK